MQAYLDLLRRILNEGKQKQQRAVLHSTGECPLAYSVFGMQAEYDLRQGFPLVTTKKVKFELIREELLWFLSGSTNANDLRARGVSIWDEWADPRTGELGPIYGQQWRKWRVPNREGYVVQYDQIRHLIRSIIAVRDDPEHPAGRRLILSAWNAPEMMYCRGPSACHTLAQFDVTNGWLSCHLYQRSADMFLGVPFNIASYALLTHLLAKVTGLEVGKLIHSFGDAHIYENHVPQVEEQLKRNPLPLPRLVLSDAITDIDGIQSDWIQLEGYRHHPALRGEVAV